MRTSLILFSAVLFLFMLFGVGYAQQGIAPHLSIAPAKIELKVKRGDIVKDVIKIINRSESAIPIEARALNFTAEDFTGSIQFSASAEPPLDKLGASAKPENVGGQTSYIDDISFNPSKWIKIEKPNFILDAGESEKINFTVQVPENAEPGGHYAVILFEPKIPSLALEEGASLIIPEIGALLMFTVEVEGVERPSEPLAISSFYLPEEERMRRLEIIIGSILPQARAETLQIIDKSLFSFILGIKNNDILHFKPEGLITIYGFQGNKVKEIEVRPQTILPGKIREFRVKLDPGERKGFEVLPKFISSRLFLGNYSAVVQLRTPDGFIAQDVFTFWIFPWKALLALFAFLIALFIVRKRIGGAVKTLVIGAPRRVLRRNKAQITQNTKLDKSK